MADIIRIVVADDHPIYRDGLVRTLEETKGFSVVGTGATADDAVAMAADLAPDMILLDISMPGNGIDAARRIAAATPDAKIVMLTVSEDENHVMDALAAGAVGYVLKGVTAAELTTVLQEVAAGRSHISPALAMRVMRAMRQPAKAPARTPIEDLTRREEDILRRVARGLSNKEVARDLGLQEKTVKHYMTVILQKLQARNRVEAAIAARDYWGSD